MARGHSILDDLAAQLGVQIPESATRADLLAALNEMAAKLEAERIPASTKPEGPIR